MSTANGRGEAKPGPVLRMGSYLREIGMRQVSLSYDDLVAQSGVGEGAGRVRVRSVDVYRILAPYVSVRTGEQLRAVLPLVAYLVLFQFFVLRQPVQGALVIALGLGAVIAGLVLFMEGLQIGLMPFSETLGRRLPAKSPLPVVLLITCLLGVGVTFAEPAIGALQAAGSLVDVNQSPYLFALLSSYSLPLVLLVGLAVGVAAVLGAIRFLQGWSLKPLIYIALAPTLLLTLYFAFDPELAPVLGLAWDCGAVTTGPVTVPLMLALGIGIAHAAGKGDGSLSGFGIVTLASLFPVLAVQLLALYVSFSVPAESIVAGAEALRAVASEPAWHQSTPFVEIVLGIRAIVPLVLFLLLVLVVVLRERLQKPLHVAYGIGLCLAGMCIFGLGLTHGLSKLGSQAGGLVPSSFVAIPGIENSPLYAEALGLSVAVLFAIVLGVGATLAEPALNALGQTVENLTSGAFRKSALMRAVALGVGAGLGLGVAKIIFGFPLWWLVVPGYLLAILLTVFSTEEFVNIAWDSAGVTTGPVTVPLVLSMGLGLGGAVDAVEGFGILAMASIGPILAVLMTGQWVRYRIRKRRELEDAALADGSEPVGDPA